MLNPPCPEDPTTPMLTLSFAETPFWARRIVGADIQLPTAAAPLETKCRRGRELLIMARVPTLACEGAPASKTLFPNERMMGQGTGWLEIVWDNHSRDLGMIERSSTAGGIVDIIPG